MGGTLDKCRCTKSSSPKGFICNFCGGLEWREQPQGEATSSFVNWADEPSSPPATAGTIKADTLFARYCDSRADKGLIDGKIDWAGWQRVADYVNAYADQRVRQALNTERLVSLDDYTALQAEVAQERDALKHRNSRDTILFAKAYANRKVQKALFQYRNRVYELKQEYLAANETAHAATVEAHTQREARERVEKALRLLVEWDKKYPRDRKYIVQYGDVNQSEKELDAICDEAAASLKSSEGAK